VLIGIELANNIKKRAWQFIILPANRLLPKHHYRRYKFEFGMEGDKLDRHRRNADAGFLPLLGREVVQAGTVAADYDNSGARLADRFRVE